MILVDNINILKQGYPNIWNKLKELEDTKNADLVQIEDTRKGERTLFIEKDEKRIYLHSKYDPIREAEAMLDKYDEVKDDTTVIFYGTGLGYHIDLFLTKYPNVNYYIYEPVPEILQEYLSYKSLRKISSSKLKGIILGDNESDIREFHSQFIDKSNNDILNVSLSSHINIFSDEYEQFVKLFKETMKDKKSSIGTNLTFQKRWITNSMKNFGDVLSTPNIMIEKRGEFREKTAILVAAGPSLNDEIEHLRYIKENGLAYIFSVGSAINTLIYHNIYPDVVCTYDPTETTISNQRVFEKVEERNITQIPMIFGSSVGYKTQALYTGDKYHMITSQDTVSSYYLKNEDDKVIKIVQDAPSIAVVTIQLLYELGFGSILLVGQNLGYRGKERYSEGISYSTDLTEEEIEKGIWVKDVYGNEILTDESFNSMRQQMEHYIKQLPNIKVINTTKGGANIEDAEFRELKDIIDKNLKDKIVEENWLDGNKTNYDKEYLGLKLKDMEKSYIKALKINKEYKDIIKKIEKVVNNRTLSQVENLYIRLDKELEKIEKNDFYEAFVLPMNRVQYKILADKIDHLNDERNPYEKGKKVLESFRNFIDTCTEDIEMINPIYEEMKNDILNYINKDTKEGEKDV